MTDKRLERILLASAFLDAPHKPAHKKHRPSIFAILVIAAFSLVLWQFMTQ